MTVASTSGRKLTIAQVALRAYQAAGLMSLQQGTSDATWPAKLAYAKDMLQVALNSMLAYGVQARVGGFSTIGVTAGDALAQVYKFPVDSNVLDVLTPAVWIADGEDVDRASAEKLVEVTTRERWQRLGSKSATGQPALLYPHREFDTIQAWLWPIPDAAGTLRMNIHRKVADTTDENATLDVEDYWLEYLIAHTARKVGEASSVPTPTLDRLTMESQRLLDYSRAKASERGSSRIRHSHRTGFRTWR